MTIVVILILTVLSVVGYKMYKKSLPNVDKSKAEAIQAPDKIEPAILENKKVKKTAKTVKVAGETVTKAKTKK